MEKGDYVLATKYSDGDPRDHWAVGFFDKMLEYSSGDRFMVVDGDGEQFRGNGFRRAERIPTECGNWMVKNSKVLEQASISIWGIRRRWRKLKKEWADICSRPSPRARRGGLGD